MLHTTSAANRVLFSVTTVLGLAASAGAQPAENLARYFGFDEPRFIIVGDNAGPVLCADFDGDGLQDIAVVNNSKSRIELHVQRARPRTDEELEKDYKVNEFAPSRWYDRHEISVPHRVAGMHAVDADGDGKLDIVYAGSPAEVVLLHQKSRLTFEIGPKRRIEKLAATQDGIEIADVMGDASPELLVVADGKIKIYPFTKNGPEGEPVELGSSGEILAFFTEDFDGDGLTDVLGVIPEDDEPLRLWRQRNLASAPGKDGQLGAEVRFEMPALREAEPVRFPGRRAASIGLIEKASRRILVDDLVIEPIAPGTGGSTGAMEHDAVAEVVGYPGGPDKDRSVTTADIDGDGRPDLLVTDKKANSLTFYQQAPGIGLGKGRVFGTFKNPKVVVAGQWDSDPELEVFVLSEDEKAVGVSDYDPSTRRLSFPQPMQISTAGATPVAMGYAKLKDGPALAVVVKDKRDHTLELHRPGAALAATIKLEGVSRPPQSTLAGDFDHDGQTDLALFTPGEPMVLVRGIDGTADQVKVLTDKQMPQFGLVQAAGPNNTALLDVDHDGAPELLIADQNFVRACEFNSEKGWRVIEQVQMPDRNSSLVGLAVLDMGGEPRLVASDKDGKRLLVMARGADKAWSVVDKLRLSGFDLGAIRAGAFSGDDQPNVLCFADAAFAIVRGRRKPALEEIASYRSDEDNRLEHEMEVGDLNGDGFTDLVVLDAKEQMSQIFTLSAARKLYLATEFKVFETRLFARGEAREFQPSAAVIADLTGDGKQDLLLVAHDRLIVYPQMSKK